MGGYWHEWDEPADEWPTVAARLLDAWNEKWRRYNSDTGEPEVSWSPPYFADAYEIVYPPAPRAVAFAMIRDAAEADHGRHLYRARVCPDTDPGWRATNVTSRVCVHPNTDTLQRLALAARAGFYEGDERGPVIVAPDPVAGGGIVAYAEVPLIEWRRTGTTEPVHTAWLCAGWVTG